MINVPKRQCFVGLFDILGFSDIVKNDKLENIWKSYIEVKSSTKFVKENWESLFKRKIINIDTFSDTFLIYTADHTNKTQNDIDEYFDALLTVCDVLFQSASTKEIPIRGAITVGELIVDESLIIGKPIVEAYEMEKNQNWIGCWISDDTVKSISKKRLDRHMNGNLILKYNIPFKKGNIKECYVFNWADSYFEDSWSHGFLRVKPNHDWCAEQKHRNTRDFIKYMREFIRNKKDTEQVNPEDGQ